MLSTLDIILHPATGAGIAALVQNPSHAVLLVGPSGRGKGTIAEHLVRSVMHIPAEVSDIYTGHPYIRLIQTVESKQIPIESIRELQHFINLRIPGSTDYAVKRAIVIENAGMMSVEAQNALLKTLEEPPSDTLIVLTATSEDALLPTIRSRVRMMQVMAPPLDIMKTYFSSQGYPSVMLDKTLMLAGDLPGLATAMLQNDESHPLVEAMTHARGILQSKTYERLLLIDMFGKQKQLCIDILFVMGRMARIALERATDQTAANRWQTVITAVYEAELHFRHNVQAKLVLTNLMLKL